MVRKFLAATLFLLIAASLMGCGGWTVQIAQETPGPNDRVNTAAAQTVAALSTDIAAGNKGTMILPINVTVTLTPTPAPVTTTPTYTPTATPGADCNQASFVRDVTIPDGSTILPNTTFTKTWELKNTGSCPWTSAYAVVFSGRGNSMSGPASAPLIAEGKVEPGATAFVSVTMRAPGAPGEYEGFWALRSADNKIFGIGIGQSASTPFYVKIKVAGEYSFGEHLCSAQWSSGAGNLPCPGQRGDSKGYVLPYINPALEDNQGREGPGWETVPENVAGGYIKGVFPAVIVPEHTDFRAILSCAPNESGCFVRMVVTYRIDNGAEQVLGEWNEGTEGSVTEAVKDLDAVAGRSTVFTFYVYSSGSPGQSKGLWFHPRIIKN